jgi:hypothetical protein
MDTDQTVTAVFTRLAACSDSRDNDTDGLVDLADPGCASAADDNEADPVTLTVQRGGDGSGAVTASGIDCGSTCSHDYDPGTSVAVTATPATGSSFDHWSGACSGTGSCTVTMDADRTVTAVFTRLRPTLSVDRQGTGGGSVAGTGISCPATCSSQYDYGAVVSLTATPAAGSTFDHWSGACSGTGPCTVTMNADRSVTAVFTRIRYTLTVERQGTGSGKVTATGIDCGATCSAQYDPGTIVTLTATAASGSKFDGWSGACSGTRSCTVTMSASRTVTAVFTDTNRRPVAKSESWTIAPGQQLRVAAPGVLGNDRDPDGDPLTAEIVEISFASSEWSGLASDGSFTYTAGPGTATKLNKKITYRAVDSHGAKSDPVTSTVTIDPKLRR